MTELGLRENPFFGYLKKRSFNAKNILAACIYSSLIAVIWSAGLLVAPGGMERWISIVVWGLSEFLVCWMVADHVFATVGRTNRIGMMDELRLTRLTVREVLLPIYVETFGLILLCLIVPILAVTVIGIVFPSDFLDLVFYLFLTINVAVTCAVALTETLRASVVYTEHSSEIRWVSSMVRLAIGLGVAVSLTYTVMFFCAIAWYGVFRGTLEPLCWFLSGLLTVGLIISQMLFFRAFLRKENVRQPFPLVLYTEGMLLILNLFLTPILILLLFYYTEDRLDRLSIVNVIPEASMIFTDFPGLLLVMTVLVLIPLKVRWFLKSIRQCEGAWTKWLANAE